DAADRAGGDGIEKYFLPVAARKSAAAVDVHIADDSRRAAERAVCKIKLARVDGGGAGVEIDAGEGERARASGAHDQRAWPVDGAGERVHLPEPIRRVGSLDERENGPAARRAVLVDGPERPIEMNHLRVGARAEREVAGEIAHRLRRVIEVGDGEVAPRL